MTWRREWWQDDSVEMFRLPDGSFRRWQHDFPYPGCGTIHGEQYMPPWFSATRKGHVTDDFGNLTVNHELLYQYAKAN